MAVQAKIILQTEVLGRGRSGSFEAGRTSTRKIKVGLHVLQKKKRYRLVGGSGGKDVKGNIGGRSRGRIFAYLLPGHFIHLIPCEYSQRSSLHGHGQDDTYQPLTKMEKQKMKEKEEKGKD